MIVETNRIGANEDVGVGG